MSRRLQREIAKLARALEEDFPADDARADGVIRLDGIRRALQKVRAAARRAAELVVPESVLRSTARMTSSTNARATSGQAARAGLPADRSRARVQDVRVDGDLGRWVRRNVALIRTVPARNFQQIEQVVREAHRLGTRHEVLAKRLVERGLVAESRARLIARDQVEKLNGQLTERRQTGLGIGSYKWRTVGDDRVRDEHLAREGQTFTWDAPPSDGHPGEPINCRCWAEPQVDAPDVV